METVALFTPHEFIELVHVNVHLRVPSKYGLLSRHDIIINRFLDGLKAAYDNILFLGRQKNSCRTFQCSKSKTRTPGVDEDASNIGLLNVDNYTTTHLTAEFYQPYNSIISYGSLYAL